MHLCISYNDIVIIIQLCVRLALCPFDFVSAWHLNFGLLSYGKIAFHVKSMYQRERLLHEERRESLQETLEDGKNSIVVPNYEGKGDALACEKYRNQNNGPLNEAVWTGIGERLRKLIKVDCRQLGFSPGKLTSAIFVMRQLQDKFNEKKELYHAFVDIAKTFDRSTMENNWVGSEKMGDPEVISESTTL